MSEWLEGRHAVEEALRGQARTVHEVVLREGADAAAGAVELARERGVPCATWPRAEFDRVATPGSGVAARCSEFRYRTPEAIPEGGEDRLVVVLDGIQDPQNLGAILRTAEVAGADAVCIPERRAAQVTPAVVRASAGASEHLPVVRVVNVARLLEQLADRGYWSVGLAPDGTQDWCEVDYRGAIALVVGAEGSGLRRLVAERCDHLVALPQRGRIGSLNASAAFAAVTFEVLRQRRYRATRPGA